jgi:hypothetical protein
MAADPSLRKQLLGDLVVMIIFGALAFAIHAFGQHLADQTRALRQEGVTVDVEVTRILKGRPRKVDVAYEHAGNRHRAEVFAWDPPPAVGEHLPGVLHPERPDRVRIRGLDEASIEEDGEPFRRLPLLFLAPLLILVVARVARLSGRHPIVAVGPAVGVVLLACVVGVNLDDGVRRVILARFGPHLLGLPSPLGLSLLEVLLLGPLLVAWGDAAVRLSHEAMQRGRSIGGWSFLVWVVGSAEAKEVGAIRRRFLVAGGALVAALGLAILGLSVV